MCLVFVCYLERIFTATSTALNLTRKTFRKVLVYNRVWTFECGCCHMLCCPVLYTYAYIICILHVKRDNSKFCKTKIFYNKNFSNFKIFNNKNFLNLQFFKIKIKIFHNEYISKLNRIFITKIFQN